MGNDLMGAKLDHELAARRRDDRVRARRHRAAPGQHAHLTGTDGWNYWYIHINNDTPGTDDGKNPARWRFAPGIAEGVHVKRGQFIAYMGDSGEAETTDPHLHFEIHTPDDTVIDPYTSLRLAQGVGANGLCAYPANPARAPERRGRTRVLDARAPTAPSSPSATCRSSGTRRSRPTDDPYVALASTPTGKGYWTVSTSGDVHAFGDAHTYGGADTLALNQPVARHHADRHRPGYWLLARDGGIFSYGDAHVLRLDRRDDAQRADHRHGVDDPAATATGCSARDGGVFSFGTRSSTARPAHEARRAGDVDDRDPDRRRAICCSRSDGGLFSFGDAHFLGSLPGAGWCPGPSALVLRADAGGGGYWMLLSDGQVVSFGNAKAWGEPSATHTTAVALAAAR